MKNDIILNLKLLCFVSVAKSQTTTDQLSTYMQAVKKDSYEPAPQGVLIASEDYNTLL